MPIKLVCFDLDGTIIENIEYIWQVLHDYFKVDELQRENARNSFFSGKLSYEDWAHHDIGLWVAKGATKKEMMKAIGHIQLVAGTRETLITLKKRGMKLAVVSGSLDIALEKVLPEYDKLFDYVFLTRLIFEKNGKLKRAIPTKFDYEHKATALKVIAKKEKISLDETMFVGDHDNDVEIAKTAGFSVAFNSKSEKLNKVANIIINKKDLREILNQIK
jgi:phosphoserine phosphatase